MKELDEFFSRKIEIPPFLSSSQAEYFFNLLGFFRKFIQIPSIPPFWSQFVHQSAQMISKYIKIENTLCVYVCVFWVAWNSILLKKIWFTICICSTFCIFCFFFFSSCFTSFDIIGKFYLYKINSNFSIYFFFFKISVWKLDLFIWHRSILTLWVVQNIFSIFYSFSPLNILLNL